MENLCFYLPDSLEEAEYAFDEILCQAELCTATEASDVENGVVSSPEYLVLNRTRGIKLVYSTLAYCFTSMRVSHHLCAV